MLPGELSRGSAHSISKRTRLVNTFYLVWNPVGNNPTMRHSTKLSATQEAERLASIHGGVFFVVEALSVSSRTNVTTEDLVHPPNSAY